MFKFLKDKLKKAVGKFSSEVSEEVEEKLHRWHLPAEDKPKMLYEGSKEAIPPGSRRPVGARRPQQEGGQNTIRQSSSSRADLHQKNQHINNQRQGQQGDRSVPEQRNQNRNDIQKDSRGQTRNQVQRQPAASYSNTQPKDASNRKVGEQKREVPLQSNVSHADGTDKLTNMQQRTGREDSQNNQKNIRSESQHSDKRTQHGVRDQREGSNVSQDQRTSPKNSEQRQQGNHSVPEQRNQNRNDAQKDSRGQRYHQVQKLDEKYNKRLGVVDNKLARLQVADNALIKVAKNSNAAKPIEKRIMI